MTWLAQVIKPFGGPIVGCNGDFFCFGSLTILLIISISLDFWVSSISNSCLAAINTSLYEANRSHLWTSKPRKLGRNSAELTCSFSHDWVPRIMSWSVASMRASRSLPFFFTLWQLMFSMRRFPRLSCKGGCYCPRCSYEWICKPFWSLWTGAYNDLPPLPLLTILFLLIFISACAFPLTAQYLTDFLVCRQKGLSKWYFFVSFFFPPYSFCHI